MALLVIEMLAHWGKSCHYPSSFAGLTPIQFTIDTSMHMVRVLQQVSSSLSVRSVTVIQFKVFD